MKRAWHTEHKRPVILDELKTSAAKRDIPIPPLLADCLKEAKAKSQSQSVVAHREGDRANCLQRLVAFCGGAWYNPAKDGAGGA